MQKYYTFSQIVSLVPLTEGSHVTAVGGCSLFNRVEVYAITGVHCRVWTGGAGAQWQTLPLRVQGNPLLGLKERYIVRRSYVHRL